MQVDKEINPGMMKYCVVGNIVKEYIDENGVLRHGTKAFPGGRKVYITKVLWKDGVTVMGLNRYKSRYIYEDVPLACIENIRASKTFKPSILKLMENNSEFPNTWWLYGDEDRQGVTAFVEMINRVKTGDLAPLSEYHRIFLEQVYEEREKE